MFWGRFKGVSRKFQGCYRKCQGCYRKFSKMRKFQGCFRGVSWFSRVFPECFKEVSRKLSRCFKKVSCAWHSSQLPEQKEGLFFLQDTKRFAKKNFAKQNLFAKKQALLMLGKLLWVPWKMKLFFKTASTFSWNFLETLWKHP